MKENKKQKRIIRHKRARAKIFGTANRPRVCVFRSNKHIYIQAIDDVKGITTVSLNDINIDKLYKTLKKAHKKYSKIKTAAILGQEFGKILKEKNIEKAVFDRSGYKYHGIVKAVAEGIRESKLII